MKISIINFLQKLFSRGKDTTNKNIDWAEHQKLLENWGKKNVWNEMRMFLFFAHGKILDLGCGTCALIQILSKNNNLDLYGCDISQDLIDYCKKRNIPKNKLKICEAPDLQVYKNNFFDHLYCIGLIQYLKENEIEKFLEEIYRITKHTAFIMIPVSNSNNNEGWIETWQAFHNNSQNWWLSYFKKIYGWDKISIFYSSWKDDASHGKWFVCSKN